MLLVVFVFKCVHWQLVCMKTWIKPLTEEKWVSLKLPVFVALDSGEEWESGPALCVCVRVHQWRSVPFQMREDHFSFIYEHGHISITAYWMTVIHIHFTQFNVTSIGLCYYVILSISLYPSWGCYSQCRCTQVERKIKDNRQRHIDRQWHIQYRLAHSCLWSRV